MGGVERHDEANVQSDEAGPRELVQEHSKESGVARNDSSVGQICLVRTGVLASVRSRGARPACALRRSTADGPARKRKKSWRGTWHDLAAAYCARSSRVPSARV
jgi:hypothetical protein